MLRMFWMLSQFVDAPGQGACSSVSSSNHKVQHNVSQLFVRHGFRILFLALVQKPRDQIRTQRRRITFLCLFLFCGWIFFCGRIFFCGVGGSSLLLNDFVREVVDDLCALLYDLFRVCHLKTFRETPKRIRNSHNDGCLDRIEGFYSHYIQQSEVEVLKIHTKGQRCNINGENGYICNMFRIKLSVGF